MVSGIYHILRTGVQWRDLLGLGILFVHVRRWCQSGLWSQMLALLMPDACGNLRSVDCSHIKVHQDASNAAGGVSAQAIGETKGGLNTKLAAVVDGLGRAVGLNLVPGNKHDLRAILPLLPTFANCRVAADHGFDAETFRDALIKIGATLCIPPRQSNRIQYYYSEPFYAQRHVVENFFPRTKRKRRVGLDTRNSAKRFLALKPSLR